MPANAGIQVRFDQFRFKNFLDSGFRRNDGKTVRSE
jgi:hypothetical protein